MEIVLEVTDIKKEFERVRLKGCPVAEGVKKQEWGLSDFCIVDPAG